VNRPGWGRPYRLLWTASTASSLGTGLTGAALPLLASNLTTQPTAISGVAAIRELPWLVLGLAAGAITDRTDRRRLAVTALTINTGIVAVLAIAVITDHASLPLIYVVSAAYATCGIFIGTATTTLTPALVPAQDLDRANSRLASTGGGASELVGPPAGSALFAIAAALPFGLETLLSATSAGLLRLLPDLPTQRESSSLWRDIVTGTSWLAHHRQLRIITGQTAVLALTDSAWFAILVLYVRRVLHESPGTYGILVGIGAFGGLAGSMVAARLGRRFGATRCLNAALLAAAAAQAALAFTADPVIATLALATSSFNFGVWNVITATLYQSQTPAHLLGRVLSAERTAVMTASPLGALLGGVVATAWGIRAPFLLGVPLLLAVALLSRNQSSDLANRPDRSL
jgi:MFS family permease